MRPRTFAEIDHVARPRRRVEQAELPGVLTREPDAAVERRADVVWPGALGHWERLDRERGVDRRWRSRQVRQSHRDASHEEHPSQRAHEHIVAAPVDAGNSIDGSDDPAVGDATSRVEQ